MGATTESLRLTPTLLNSIVKFEPHDSQTVRGLDQFGELVALLGIRTAHKLLCEDYNLLEYVQLTPDSGFCPMEAFMSIEDGSHSDYHGDGTHGTYLSDPP